MSDYVVFTPDNPNLYSLNQAARLVLAFCDGRTGIALENAYCAAVGGLASRQDAAAELRRTVTDLERKGIVLKTPPAKPRGAKNNSTVKENRGHGNEEKVHP